MLMIPPEIREAIGQHAAEEYPRECCGILVGNTAPDGRVIVGYARPARNAAPAERRHHRYDLEPLAIVHADRFARERGMDIVGVYHSHPDHQAVPSATDTSLAWEGYAYLIVAVTAAGAVDMRTWRLDAAAGNMREMTLADA